MKITFVSSVKLPPVNTAFATLTSGAVICIDDIRYDAAEGIVEIPMKHRALIEPRKSFWGRPIYHGQTWANAILTIRQVVAMKLEVDNLLVTDCNSCFTIMMGMKIDGNEIYFGSLEEVKGKTLCHVFITINGINLEFVDLA